MVCSVTAAYLIIKKEIRHCLDLEAAVKLVDYTKSKAEVYGMPFAEIIAETNGDKELERLRIGEIFVKKSFDKNDIAEVWKETVNEAPIQLEDYERDILIHFGERMCVCSKEEIRTVSENAIYSLNCFKETAVENRNKRSKSIAAICVSLGTIIILMFA